MDKALLRSLSVTLAVCIFPLLLLALAWNPTLLMEVALVQPEATTMPTLVYTQPTTVPLPELTPLPVVPPTAPPAEPERVADVAALPSRLAAHNMGYVPILMYHYIREVDKEADPLGFRLSVTPERFAEQMQWLRDNGYTALRMSDLAACLRAIEPCPTKPVALTFDDGYADNYTEALPILREYGFTATFYIATGYVNRPGFMTWQQLHELRDSGMEIGSHTINHADLTGLTLNQARVELVQSRAVLERWLEVPVLSFSYPAGGHNAALASLVRSAGYTSAVITAPRDDYSHMYKLSRRRVLGGEAIAGYPWYFRPAAAQVAPTALAEE